MTPFILLDNVFDSAGFVGGGAGEESGDDFSRDEEGLLGGSEVLVFGVWVYDFLPLIRGEVRLGGRKEILIVGVGGIFEV